MKRLIVRYKVKPDRVAENEHLISKVFEELAARDPSGFAYASFKLDDGVSFVHLVFEGESGSDVSLADLPSFRAFTADIAERCDEAPVASEMNEVGSHRFS